MNQASIRELLASYASVMEQLRERGVVRSSNNPVADYCESLVVRALGLKRSVASTKGCDAVDTMTEERYEIKGRRITKHNPSTQLSVIRDIESCHFDYLAGVLFDEDFTVARACRIPRETVEKLAVPREHVNGRILLLRPSVWDQPGVRDITAELMKAQREWI